MAEEKLIVLGHDLTNAMCLSEDPLSTDPSYLTYVCPRCGRYLTGYEIEKGEDVYTCETFFKTGRAEYWIDDMQRRVEQGSMFVVSGPHLKTGMPPPFVVTRLY